MREVTEAANRNNTSFYSLDPRGLAPFEYGFDDLPSGPPPSFATDARALRMTQDTLRSLSDDTDGKAIVNRNTLEQGLAQVVRDSSYYYLLGYTSQSPNDGKFHQITVRVKRRDVNVRARRGFWAITPEDAIKAATPSIEVAKPVQTALASISTSVQAGKYVRTWLGTERGEGGNTRVTLVWEPLTFPPGDRREPAGRVSLLAATEGGNVVFRGRAPERGIVPSVSTGSLGPSGAAGAAAAAPAPQRLTFDAPPGKVELRITVEGSTGGTLDQEIRDIEYQTSRRRRCHWARRVSIGRGRFRSFGLSRPTRTPCRLRGENSHEPIGSSSDSARTLPEPNAPKRPPCCSIARGRRCQTSP